MDEAKKDVSKLSPEELVNELIEAARQYPHRLIVPGYLNDPGYQRLKELSDETVIRLSKLWTPEPPPSPPQATRPFKIGEGADDGP